MYMVSDVLQIWDKGAEADPGGGGGGGGGGLWGL